MFQTELKDRKIILTGGSSGIGRAMVEVFSKNGAEVVFADIKPPDSEIDNTNYIEADLSMEQGMAEFCKMAEDRIGIPDVLVLNAGQGINQSLHQGKPEQWEKVIQINMLSSLRVINHFLKGMRDKGFADIVFISSVSSIHPYQNGAVYSATKAAIDNIAEVLRLENIGTIRVTTIAPGVVDTEFFKHNIDGTDDVESLNMGAVDPEEIADAVKYAITRRRGMAINYMVIRPLQQAM